MGSKVWQSVGVAMSLVFIGACHKAAAPPAQEAADLVVLDQDVFKIPVTDIARTKVLTTVIGGEVVHGKL